MLLFLLDIELNPFEERRRKFWNGYKKKIESNELIIKNPINKSIGWRLESRMAQTIANIQNLL